MKKLAIIILVLTALGAAGCAWYQTPAGQNALSQPDYWQSDCYCHYVVACGERRDGESQKAFEERLEREAILKLIAAGKEIELDDKESTRLFMSSSGQNACAIAQEAGHGHLALEALAPKGKK